MELQTAEAHLQHMLVTFLIPEREVQKGQIA